jgi:hypothetical protein
LQRAFWQEIEMQEPMLTTDPDYYVPLLRLLAEQPDGIGRSRDVIGLFGERHHDRIPAKDFEGLPSTPKEPRWANRVAWARQALKDMGFVDAPAWGVWRITQAGRDWLAQHPDATHLSPTTRQQRAGAGPRSRTPSPRSKTAIPAGLTRDLLEQTRQAMPADQFQQIWGAIYQALLAEERTKAITTLTDSSLKERARKPVRRIHAFIQGRGNDAPKSEEICDWIHFCYTLELYREAAALWQYVNQDDVHPWQYERTKRVAAVCRTKT